MRRGRKWQIECRKNNLNRQRQTAQKHVFRCATRRNASNSLVFLPIHYNPFRENTFFLCVCVYSLSRKREYRRQTSLTLGNTRAVRVNFGLSGVIDEWIQGYCAKTSQKKSEMYSSSFVHAMQGLILYFFSKKVIVTSKWISPKIDK